MNYFKIGDLILSCKPYAFALYSEERIQRCDYCFKLILNRISCVNCEYTNYCSRKCINLSYTIHVKECQILKNRPLCNLTRLLNRVLIENELNPNRYDIVDGKKRFLKDLINHVNEIKKDQVTMLEFSKIFSELELINGEILNVDNILNYFGLILVNSFAIQNEKLTPIGRGIYLGASIFDHSCLPNATFTFIETDIYIKSNQELNINNLREVYISYINELNQQEERNLILEQQYYFKCNCKRCLKKINESNNFASEVQLKSICDLIDKLNIDYLTYIYKYLENKKLNNNSIKNFNEFDLRNYFPENAESVIKLVEISVELHKNIKNINGPLTCKVFDFLSIITKNIKLSIIVIDYFRKYYGLNHPKLAFKLYLTSLLLSNSDSKLKNRLLDECLKICQIFTPSLNQIKSIKIHHDLNYLNNTFLFEIEKQFFTSKRSIQFNSKIITYRQKNKSSFKQRFRFSSVQPIKYRF